MITINNQEAEYIVSILNAIVEDNGYDVDIFGFGYNDERILCNDGYDFEEGLEWVWGDFLANGTIDKTFNEFLNKPILDINYKMSVRLRSGIRWYFNDYYKGLDIVTVRDVLNMNKKKLFRTRNVGKQTMSEFERLIDYLNKEYEESKRANQE